MNPNYYPGKTNAYPVHSFQSTLPHIHKTTYYLLTKHFLEIHHMNTFLYELKDF